MIYDCFTFFNELDLLEIRLNTLASVVDRFVIAEATRTHSGKPKELLFEKNRERYAAFADKIIYIVVDDLLPEEEVSKDTFNLPWVNENRQRNALIRGLSAAKDDDVIMVSDLDEIPRPEKITDAVVLARNGEIVRFLLDVYVYFANFRDYRTPCWGLGTQMLSMATCRKSSLFDDWVYDRFTVKSENLGSTINKVRFLKPTKCIRHGGWHMTYLGGVDAVRTKLQSFSHQEAACLLDSVEERLKAGKSIFGGMRDSFGVRLDETFPKYLVSNAQRFEHLIFEITDDYLKRTAFARRIAYARGVCYRFCVRLVPGFLVGPLSKVMIRIRMR